MDFNDETSEILPQISSVFKKRAGTTDVGKNYEHLYIAYIILKFVTDENVETFHLSSNNEDFGSFDDVVVELKYRNKEKVTIYALQLKHSNNGTVSNTSLAAPSGNFSINQYIQNFCETTWPSDVKLILFTNRRADVKPNFTININDETVNVCGRQEEACELLTTNPGSCYHFTSDKYEEFFRNFYVYANQANVNQIEKSAAELFNNMFGSGGDAFKNYLDFITKWSLKEGRKNKLEKSWIKRKLFLCNVFPLVKTLSFSGGEVDNKRKMFREAVATSHITCLQGDCYDKVRDLWKDVIKEVDLNDLNKVRVKYLIEVKQIRTETNLREEMKEISVLLWLLGLCPLVLEGSPQLLKALKICNQTNVIALDLSNCFEDAGKLLVFRHLSDLKRHIQIYDKILNFYTYSLESQKQEPLKYLIEICEDFNTTITTDKLVRMFDKPLSVGGSRNNLPSCYIPRKLTRIVIDSQFLKALKDDTIAIVIGVNNFLSFVQNFQSMKITESIDDDTNKVLNITTTKMSTFATVEHYFRYLDDFRLEWLKSKTTDENRDYWQDLSKFRLIDDCYNFTELEIFENSSDDLYEAQMHNVRESDINLICANPGMGKSTFVKSLKINSSSLEYTVVVLAKYHTKYLKKRKPGVEEFLSYILHYATNHCNTEDKEFCRMFTAKKKMRIIWDGLDEVYPKALSVILNTIEAISKTGIKQWLTFRYRLKHQIEARFHTFARTIKPFDNEEQEKYIRKTLNGATIETVNKIKANIKNFSNEDLLGVPLQIYMLTELVVRSGKKYLELLDKTFSILNLYEHFVVEKFLYFYAEMLNQDFRIEKNQKRCKKDKKYRLNCYKQIAYNSHFKTWWTTLSDSFPCDTDLNYFKKTIKANGDDVGFITALTNDNVEFTHNSYGEFFAALYLFTNDPQKLRNKKFIANDIYNNIRFFLDLMLSQKAQAFLAALYRDFPSLEKCTLEELNSRDKIGRDVLEVTCSWVRSYWIPELIQGVRYKFPTNIEESTEMLNYKTTKAYFKKISPLINISTRKLLLFSPFLIIGYDKELDDFRKEFLPTILFYAVKLDDVQVYNCINTSNSLNSAFSDIEPISLLVLALHCQSRRVLEMIMLNECYHIELMEQFKHIVKDFGPKHIDSLTYLVNLRSSKGKTLFDYAREQNKFDVINLLNNMGAQVTAPDHNELFSIKNASKEGVNSETISLLRSSETEGENLD